MDVYRQAKRNRCKREAKKLFNDNCVHFNIVSNDFVGVNVFNFVDLDDFFKYLILLIQSIAPNSFESIWLHPVMGFKILRTDSLLHQTH